MAKNHNWLSIIHASLNCQLHAESRAEEWSEVEWWRAEGQRMRGRDVIAMAMSMSLSTSMPANGQHTDQGLRQHIYLYTPIFAGTYVYAGNRMRTLYFMFHSRYSLLPTPNSQHPTPSSQLLDTCPGKLAFVGVYRRVCFVWAWPREGISIIIIGGIDENPWKLKLAQFCTCPKSTKIKTGIYIA